VLLDFAVAPALRRGHLLRVLPGWSGTAQAMYAVYPALRGFRGERLAESELCSDPARDTRAIDIALAPLVAPAPMAHH
jgi:hypothetical protein